MTKTCGRTGDGLASGLGLGATIGDEEGDGLGLGTATAALEVQAAPTRIAQVATARMRPVVKIAAGRWQLEAKPERGGRIVSLRLDGEELLDQGIGVDQPTADRFVDGGAFGWDEMVPNVDETDTLPDHGEAWRLPCRVLRAAGIEVAMSCRGRVLPWELTRSIYLRDSLIALYAYRNVGKEPHQAYWCAHPLFKFETGMEIGVPGGAPDVADGKSSKLFLPRGGVDGVRLRWRSGRGIEMSWDPALTPYVGVWICNGDLGGYRQIAIEPATGGSDRPDPAAPPPVLMPGETLKWWLQIRPLEGLSFGAS